MYCRRPQSGALEGVARVTWAALVDRIATLAGVEPWYYDLRGERHETSLGSKVLVLSALKLDVSSIPAAKASLAALEEESWRRLLAPVIVERDQSPTIALFVPAADAQRLHKWRGARRTWRGVEGEIPSRATS